MISHLEYGTLNYWVRFKDKDLTDEDIKKLEEESKKEGYKNRLLNMWIKS